ncbi:MAG: hypothetical protein AB8G22_28340 [Saprospiraceae bacterium]
MRSRTLYLEDVTIEVHRSDFGMEKVIVNGELVSKKRCWRSNVHEFEVEKEGVTQEYEVLTRRLEDDFAVDIYADDKPILESAYSYSDSQQMFAYIIFLFLIMYLGYIQFSF